MEVTVIARRRSKATALLLATFVMAGSSPAITVHAQDQAPGDLFTLPSTGDLQSDGGRTVNDQPAATEEVVDLSPVVESAAQTIAALPAEDWEVTALAATLPDADAAFALVRDSVRFDAYAGLLRGAAGALSARAGNAYDRAALLKALLDAQRQTSRFAFGTLDAETASSLVTRSFADPAAPLPSADARFSAELEIAVDARARRDNALVLAAIGDRLADLDADATAQAQADVTRHSWVQLQQPDGTWLDLDPSMPDAQPGQTLTSAEITADAVPDSDVAMVTLRLNAEMLQGGQLATTAVLDVGFRAWAAADQQIVLTFTPTSGTGGGLLGSPGGMLGGGGGGQASWTPIIDVDGLTWYGEPVLLTGEVGGGGLLGPGEQADLVSLSLDVEATVPGYEPDVLHRVLADRLAPDVRAAGAVTPEDLAPVADVDGAPVVFQNILHVMVSTGGSNPRVYAAEQDLGARMSAWIANATDTSDLLVGEAMIPAATTDEMLVTGSEQRFLPAIDGGDARAYVAAPRVYLATRTVDPADVTAEVTQTDLLQDGIRVLPSTDSAPEDAVRRQIWYGALQGALETEYMLANGSTILPDGRTLKGVSLDMGLPLSVVTGSDPAIPAADDRLAEILAHGGLAVVPGDSTSATTWWEVAHDGSTRSVAAPSVGAGISAGPPAKTPAIPKPGAPQKPGDQNPDEQKGTEYPTTVDISSQVTEAAGKTGQKLINDMGAKVSRVLNKTDFGVG
jgi:hypothetical protein